MPTRPDGRGPAAAALLAAAVLAAPAWAAPGGADPACVEAVRAADPAAARSACDPARPLEAYNLAIVLWETAPAAAREHLDAAVAGGLAEAAHVRGNIALDAGDVEAGLADLEAAAFAGLALAQYDYATALLEHGEADDRSAAVRWYGRAAAGGEAAARYNLGVLLLNGGLGTTDALWAWAWLSSLESLDGHSEVYRVASELGGQMDADERETARAHLEAVREDPVAAAERLAALVAGDAGGAS
jgi:TPR repeat protein